MNVFSNGPPCNAGCQKSLTYIVGGKEHINDVGRGMDDDAKPSTVVLSNPSLTLMDGIKGKRSLRNKKKVLVLNFTPLFDTTAARYFKQDKYMLGVLGMAEALISEGYRVTYRKHVSEDPRYSAFFFNNPSFGEGFKIDDSGSFSDALANHGIVISNVTSGFYQALYAGWPAIFFEPVIN